MIQVERNNVVLNVKDFHGGFCLIFALNEHKIFTQKLHDQILNKHPWPDFFPAEQEWRMKPGP